MLKKTTLRTISDTFELHVYIHVRMYVHKLSMYVCVCIMYVV